MINFYHRFIKGIAQIMGPINALLSHKTRKDARILWTRETNASFENAKQALMLATVLYHPIRDAETSIAVDASNIAVGGVLQQKVDDN